MVNEPVNKGGGKPVIPANSILYGKIPVEKVCEGFFPTARSGPKKRPAVSWRGAAFYGSRSSGRFLKAAWHPFVMLFQSTGPPKLRHIGFLGEKAEQNPAVRPPAEKSRGGPNRAGQRCRQTGYAALSDRRSAQFPQPNGLWIPVRLNINLLIFTEHIFYRLFCQTARRLHGCPAFRDCAGQTSWLDGPPAGVQPTGRGRYPLRKAEKSSGPCAHRPFSVLIFSPAALLPPVFYEVLLPSA